MLLLVLLPGVGFCGYLSIAKKGSSELVKLVNNTRQTLFIKGINNINPNSGKPKPNTYYYGINPDISHNIILTPGQSISGSYSSRTCNVPAWKAGRNWERCGRASYYIATLTKDNVLYSIGKFVEKWVSADVSKTGRNVYRNFMVSQVLGMSTINTSAPKKYMSYKNKQEALFVYAEIHHFVVNSFVSNAGVVVVTFTQGRLSYKQSCQHIKFGPTSGGYTLSAFCINNSNQNVKTSITLPSKKGFSNDAANIYNRNGNLVYKYNDKGNWYQWCTGSASTTSGSFRTIAATCLNNEHNTSRTSYSYPKTKISELDDYNGNLLVPESNNSKVPADKGDWSGLCTGSQYKDDGSFTTIAASCLNGSHTLSQTSFTYTNGSKPKLFDTNGNLLLSGYMPGGYGNKRLWYTVCTGSQYSQRSKTLSVAKCLAPGGAHILKNVELHTCVAVKNYESLVPC